MPRTKIKDLPVLQDLDNADMKQAKGSGDPLTHEIANVVQQTDGLTTTGSADEQEIYEYPGLYAKKDDGDPTADVDQDETVTITINRTMSV